MQAVFLDTLRDPVRQDQTRSLNMRSSFQVCLIETHYQDQFRMVSLAAWLVLVSHALAPANQIVRVSCSTVLPIDFRIATQFALTVQPCVAILASSLNWTE